MKKTTQDTLTALLAVILILILAAIKWTFVALILWGIYGWMIK